MEIDLSATAEKTAEPAYMRGDAMDYEGKTKTVATH